MILFSRNRNSISRLVDSNTLQIVSSLLDTVHEMELAISIDLTNYNIKDVIFEIKRAPYTFCFDMVQKATVLVGFNVMQGGAAKRLTDIFHGKEGCLQLADLSIEAIKMVNQSVIGMLPGGRLEMLKTFDQRLQGTCYGHSQPLEEKIKAVFNLVPGQIDKI